MIKEYRKVVTVKAERFYGSNEMIEKYPIEKMEYTGLKDKNSEDKFN